MDSMKKNIGLRVRNLVRKFNTKDPYEICKKLNIQLICRDLGKRKGFCRRIKGIDFIFINSNFSEFLQLIILLHEMGHIILKHPRKDVIFMKTHFLGVSNKLENEANLFLSEFLVQKFQDEELEMEILKEDKKILESIMELRKRLGK